MKLGGAFAGAVLVMAATAAAAADEEPICADRPGKANPSCTVPPGMVQVETSFFDWSHDRSGEMRTDELIIGDTAIKFGLTERLHIEFNLTPYSQTRTRAGGLREREFGFGDAGVALKYRLTADDAPVQAAVYPFVKIPTAKRLIGNGKVEGGVALLVDGPIPGTPFEWNIAPELDLVADSDGSGRHLAMVQVISLGVPLSSRLGVAVDLWGQWGWDPAGTDRQYSIGPSLAYLLSNNVQLDGGVDFGLNRNTPDVQVYSGIALRF